MHFNRKRIKHLFKDRLGFLTWKVRKGPLKGKKWSVVAGLKFLNGRFEPYKTKAFLQMINKNDVFFDIGGHVGYFSSMASEVMSEKGQVVAFEPRPLNARFFRRHIKINALENVTLYQAAVGKEETEASFDINQGTATGKLDPEGDITVKVVCIDDMVDRKELPAPDFIKIDVEGGETDVLKGCEQTIEKYKPKLLLATHSDTLFKNCTEWLSKRGYQYRVLNRDGIKGDTEIMAWHNTPA